MGERKGTNKWYPPDYDPRKGGLNKWQGTHALRERARKLHLGILIIRFEMPYNIWCEGCGNHVGMGVRYNAEKKKVGMYYTTPVYQFRMKCHLCDNHFEIKTDPANLDYEIVSGARRQERRWDPTQNAQVVPDDKAVGRKLQDDAMFKLEHGEQDKGKGKGSEQNLRKLSAIQDRVRDDYLANRILRDDMRAKRKVMKATKATDDALRKKASLDIDLVPEHKDDVLTASLLSLQPSVSSEERQSSAREAIAEESIFTPSTSSSSSSSANKRTSSSSSSSQKERLAGMAKRHRLETRLSASSPMKSLGIVLTKDKKKKEKSEEDKGNKVEMKEEEEEVKEEEKKQEEKPKEIPSLCDYGSSSSSSADSD